MEKKEVILDVKKFVREKLEGEGSGHDWWHVVRTYNNALDIAKEENNDRKINMRVVELAALLHDVADHKFGYSDEDRERIIEEQLSKHDVDSEDIKHVIYIVNNISFKGGENTHIMQTIEGEIVQDADRLDAIGAIGIGRTFAYGGYKGRVMYDPEDKRGIDEKEDTLNHFYEKLLLLKGKMNTKSGLEKAERRHNFMESFLSEFYREWNGER